MTNEPKDEIAQFELERKHRIESYAACKDWHALSRDWMLHAFRQQYMYNFTSLGRPIIQTPVDMISMQALIWQVRPDLIIETGIAHGGSLIMSASMLALLDYCDAVESDSTLDPRDARRTVLGIDIDIREHNRKAIEEHPMSHRIQMIQGSSIDPVIIGKVREIATGFDRILVCLDSNHTHEHVRAELNAYASLVTVGSYCVIFDTIVEDLPAETFPNRPWAPGNNPKTAVHEFLQSHPQFEIDQQIDQKLLVSLAPDGYLRRVY